MENDFLPHQDEKLISGLKENLDKIKEISGNSSDLLINEITVSGIKCTLLCCEGMLSTATITELILNPLTKINIKNVSSDALMQHINNYMLLSTDRVKVTEYATLFRTVNSGFAVLIADGCGYGWAFGVQGYDKRSISEPSGEQNILGSHEGFVEVVRTNMSLIRRRMKSPAMKFELFVMGSRSQTDLCLCYMQDRVPSGLLEEIKKNLSQIELETILSTGYVKPFLESRKLRIFSSVGVTERPDVLCSKLLEGRVALLVDGTPFALVIPKLFIDGFQTMDDYNYKPYYACFLRWLKYLSFITALFLPALYIAVAIHHPHLLNPTLLDILEKSEENAPFSIMAETVGVLLVYEIIREAGLRLPEVVGGAVSIVGGLVIGTSAVDSGLISTPLLITSAIAVVSGFLTPDYSQQITVLRLILVIAGGIWGLYGISLVTIIILFNVCATEDYGFPTAAPVTPFTFKAMRDVLTRVGFRRMQNGDFTIDKLNRR